MDNPPRQIDILLYDGVNALDVAGPAQAFIAANTRRETRYRLRFVSADGGGVSAHCGLRLGADAGLSDARLSDAGLSNAQSRDILVPGGQGVDQAMDDPRIIDGLRGWRDGAGRVISVCSGALILARAGFLDGRKATTHWARDHQARELFPAVRWSTNDLYHIDGRTMTSAGVTAGIDLTLDIIRRDYGGDLALLVARELVVYLKRPGGQNQFADLLEAQFSGNRDLARLISALQTHPGRDWTLERMADCAGLTPRTLSRRFGAAFGQSPVKYLERYRVKRATDMLVSGAPVGRAIAASGFADFQRMQRAFKRQLGTTIGDYQRKFSSPE